MDYDVEFKKRFLNKINIDCVDACWEWTGQNIEGMVHKGNKNLLLEAHRVSYEIFNGKLETDYLFVTNAIIGVC